MRWIVTRTVLSCCLLIAPFASLGFEKQALPPNEWVDLLNRGYELWDIFCDPNVPGRLFATGLVIQSESVDDQLMFPILSTDSGTTWKPLTSSISDWGYVFSPDDISLSVVCPDSTQRILYCIRGVTENRCLIFRSTDLGVSWINSGEATNCLATAVQAHPTHDWLLASRSSYYSESVGNTNHTGNVELIMKSTDGGATWTQKAYYNSPSSLTGISRFCFNPIQTEHVIAVCRSGFGEKLLMSTDSGENWQAIDTGPDWQLDTGVRGIAFHPTQPDTFVAIHDDFFSEMHHSLKRTTDRGATWSDWGPEDCSAVGFFFHPDNPEVMFTVSESSTDSIYKSTDTGLSWVVKREYSEEQGNVKTRSVFMIPNGDTDLYCNISGLLRSKDMGESWGAMYFVDGSFNRNSAWIDPTNEQNILISQEYIGTFCTFDAGDHWEVLSSGYENGFDLGCIRVSPAHRPSIHFSKNSTPKTIHSECSARVRIWEPLGWKFHCKPIGASWSASHPGILQIACSLEGAVDIRIIPSIISKQMTRESPGSKSRFLMSFEFVIFSMIRTSAIDGISSSIAKIRAESYRSGFQTMRV